MKTRLLLGIAATCGAVALPAALLWGPSGTTSTSTSPSPRAEEQAPTAPPAPIDGVRSVVDPTVNVTPMMGSPVFETYVPTPPDDTLEARIAALEKLIAQRPPVLDERGAVVPAWRVQVENLQAEWNVRLSDQDRERMEFEARSGWPDGQEQTFLRLAAEWGYEPKQTEETDGDE